MMYYLIDTSFGSPLVISKGTEDEMRELIEQIGYPYGYKIMTEEDLESIKK